MPLVSTLAVRPVIVQHFEPAFLLEHLDDVQGIVFVSQCGDLVPDGRLQDVIDVLAFFGGVVTRLRALFERPVKTGGKARRANQARRIFQE